MVKPSLAAVSGLGSLDRRSQNGEIDPSSGPEIKKTALTTMLLQWKFVAIMCATVTTFSLGLGPLANAPLFGMARTPAHQLR